MFTDVCHTFYRFRKLSYSSAHPDFISNLFIDIYALFVYCNLVVPHRLPPEKQNVYIYLEKLTETNLRFQQVTG